MCERLWRWGEVFSQGKVCRVLPDETWWRVIKAVHSEYVSSTTAHAALTACDIAVVKVLQVGVVCDTKQVAVVLILVRLASE